MIRRAFIPWFAFVSVFAALTGCQPQEPFHFFDDGDLSHYVEVATDIDYPDVQTESLEETTQSGPPLTLENIDVDQMWELTLEEAVHSALANSKVMRSLGGRYNATAQVQPPVGGAPEAVVNNNVLTIYDPAIVETTPFIGVESALAAFDAQFTSNIFWEKNDRPQNVNATGAFGGFFTPVFEQDAATFNAQITKVTATGGQFGLRHNVQYDQNNNPTRQVPSDYNVNFEATFSQPLLQGAGVQYNRIAGPNSPFSGTGSATFDGVMLARINMDISLADFEAGVRNLVSDVENTYWDLYFDYRNLESTKAARASALQTWKKVHALYVTGSRGGEAEKEAQAREQYFFFRAQVHTAFTNLLRDENRLRYIMGLTVADGRLIRPSDEPTTAEVKFDWAEVHAEALARSVDLRRQKWRIKQRELELIAARNQLLPRLDAVGRYRWLGLGDDLINSSGQPETGGVAGTNAWQNLVGGDFQEWQLGLQASIPIGFRRELSTVRHFQLQLARERARLQDAELEVVHQLADAQRSLSGNHQLTQDNFNRRVAAERQVEAVGAAYENGTVTLDLLLDAQRRQADAEVAYYRSLVDYNRSIGQLHYRKGSLLEYNNVYLAEGPWPAKALFDAHRLARQRDASFYLDYGYTRPRVISEGHYEQHADEGQLLDSEESLPSEAIQPGVETVPTPPAAPVQPAEQPVRSPGREARGSSKMAATGRRPSIQLRSSRPVSSEVAESDGGETEMGHSSVLVRTEKQAEGSAPGPVLKQPGTIIKSGSTEAKTESESGVRRASYEWKSSSPEEPRSNQAAGESDRSAAGWKGAKR
jgi:outer membrane protein TolC